MYVAVFGHWSSQVHYWHRVQTWNDACEWLGRFEDVSKIVPSSKLPGHIFHDSQLQKILGSDGKPIYTDDHEEKDAGDEFNIRSDGKLIPGNLPTTVVAVIGRPGADIHLWERCKDWPTAVDWIKQCNDVLMMSGSNKHFPAAHVLPEAVALSILDDSGHPVYPRGVWEKANVVIFN